MKEGLASLPTKEEVKDDEKEKTDKSKEDADKDKEDKEDKEDRDKRQRRLRDDPDDPDKTMTMKGDRMFTGIYILRLLMVWTVPLR